MSTEIKRLGDAELEIMQAVWAAGEAVNSARIQEALRGKRDWALSTLLTALNRLCEKGFLACEKQGRGNLYRALVEQEAYLQRESRSFLQKMYGNSVTGLVASLYDGKTISDSDMAELRRYLERWEAKK
ncbi:MAG: BlaI/MecI/CopY family transcriptional regulator [Syntrophomonadaceae bacterium]|nr:BlaI/MecI/CopY family transcriptional regulator [Syntrophomonadaceae bacterium]